MNKFKVANEHVKDCIKYGTAVLVIMFIIPVYYSVV